MAEHTHIKLSGDIGGRYVLTDQRAGGELTLVPDTSREAILERSGGREMTPTTPRAGGVGYSGPECG